MQPCKMCQHFGKQELSQVFPQGVADRSIPRFGERRARRRRMIFESQDRADAMVGIAIGTAVGEARSDLPQIVCADRLGAERARRLTAGRPAIHQDESHRALLMAVRA